MKSTLRNLILFSGATAAQLYDTRVLATSPLRYNKLNETSGTAIVDSSGNAYTGTYSGVTLASIASPFLPDNAPLWDGVNDYADMYSASFGSAFNLDEFTFSYWFKVANAGVWTDGTARRLVSFVRDSSNFFRVLRSVTNGVLTIDRNGSGTTKTISLTSLSSTAWNCFQISASVAGGGLLAAGEMKAYINGVEVGTVAANIASAGTGLSSAQTLLGARIIPPDFVTSGYFSRFMIHNSAITTSILALGTP